jgi:hypothetical protein
VHPRGCQGYRGGERGYPGIQGGIPGVDPSTSQAGQGVHPGPAGGGQGVCRGWPPPKKGLLGSKPGVIEGVTVGLNSPRDDHVSKQLEPLNKVADVDHLYKGPAVAPKGLAYATPD